MGQQDILNQLSYVQWTKTTNLSEALNIQLSNINRSLKSLQKAGFVESIGTRGMKGRQWRKKFFC